MFSGGTFSSIHFGIPFGITTGSTLSARIWCFRYRLTAVNWHTYPSRPQLTRCSDMSLLAFHISTQLFRIPRKCSESLSRASVSAVCHSSAIITTLLPASTAGRTTNWVT